MGTKDMDEEKKTLGRAKIYTGEPEEPGRNQVRTGGKARQTSADRRADGAAAGNAASDNESGRAPAGDRRSRRAEPIGTKPKEHLAAEPGRRRRELETEAQMRRLWALLGVLVVILIVAIVYEIVLGHANVETGSQRMDQTVQETEMAQVSETEQITETEQTGETENDGEASADADSAGENGNTVDSTAGDAGSGDADDNVGDGSSADASAGDVTTLAGLDD